VTAQIADRLTYEGKDYAFVAIERPWPFDPTEHGFRPVMRNTACRRGYHCAYALGDGGLHLTRLSIWLGGIERLKPPRWRGIDASAGSSEDRCWEYLGPNLPTPYSGGMIVGREFLREFYVHMGFHRAHCYAEVRELLFKEGALTDSIDHSAKMNQVRESIRQGGTGATDKPASRAAADVERWVNDAFTTSYEKKWR